MGTDDACGRLQERQLASARREKAPPRGALSGPSMGSQPGSMPVLEGEVGITGLGREHSPLKAQKHPERATGEGGGWKAVWSSPQPLPAFQATTGHKVTSLPLGPA